MPALGFRLSGAAHPLAAELVEEPMRLTTRLVSGLHEIHEKMSIQPRSQLEAGQEISIV